MCNGCYGIEPEDGTYDWGRCVKCMASRSRPPLMCVECGKGGCEVSGLLLDDGGVIEDWVDRPWARCFRCSKFDDDVEFEMTAIRRCDQRGHTMWPEGLRISKLRKAMRVLEKLFPGATQRQLRSLTLKRREAAAMAMATALDQDSEELRWAARHVAEQYFNAIRAAVANPAYRVSCHGTRMDNTEAAYLTDVAEGVTVVFCVGCTNCGFGAASDGPFDGVGGDLTCPTCDLVYYAQTFLKITDPNSGLVFCFPGKWPHKCVNNTWTIEEDGWLNLMVQSEARNIQTGEDLDAFVQKSVVNLSNLLATVATPIGFMSRASSSTCWPTCWPEPRRWPELIGLLANVLAGAKALANVSACQAAAAGGCAC